MLLLLALTVHAQQKRADGQEAPGLSFQPDFVFQSSSLAGFEKLGHAKWTASAGAVTGVAEEAGPSLLLMNRSLQDVAFYAEIQTENPAGIGILFRVEHDHDGFKGIMVGFDNNYPVLYAVALDSEGKERYRNVLRRAGNITRLAPPARPGQPSGESSSGRRINNSLNLPLQKPQTSWKEHQWNSLEVMFDLNIIRAYLNDSGETGGADDTDEGNFGPVGLYIAAGTKASFRNIAFKDIGIHETPAEITSSNFSCQRINDMFYSWGCSAADFNRDGQVDIVAGPYVYYGPDFARYREIYPAFALNPSKDFAEINAQYTYDFNGDGWPDILTGPPNAAIYLNPGAASRRWDKFEAVSGIQSEITLFTDMDGDKKPELIFCMNGSVCIAKPDQVDWRRPWSVHPITEKGYAMPHGLGSGDINADGRKDIVNPNGWWEQPKVDTGQLWAYHSTAFGRYAHRSTNAGGSLIGVFDVDGDGLNDVVTSLNAHGFGLAWFKQHGDKSGAITFARYLIADNYRYGSKNELVFSEAHGAAVADMDKDGIPDFIIGKRYWSHLDSYLDPDPYGPPVLYILHTRRDPDSPGGAKFIPELIHNRSGAGSDLFVGDINLDGHPDIVTATDRGTFLFINKGTDNSLNRRPRAISTRQSSH